MLRVCPYGLAYEKKTHTQIYIYIYIYIYIHPYITKKDLLGVAEAVEMKYLQRITQKILL